MKKKSFWAVEGGAGWGPVISLSWNLRTHLFLKVPRKSSLKVPQLVLEISHKRKRNWRDINLWTFDGQWKRSGEEEIYVFLKEFLSAWATGTRFPERIWNVDVLKWLEMHIQLSRKWVQSMIFRTSTVLSIDELRFVRLILWRLSICHYLLKPTIEEGRRSASLFQAPR